MSTLSAWWQSPQLLLDSATPIVLNVLSALLIFFVGKWIIKRLIWLFRRVMKTTHVDDMLTGFLANVLYGLGLTVVALAALGKLGVDTTSAAAVLGGTALAIGLALQGQLASFAAGVILIVFRPFKKGDLVEVGGTTGIVEEIKIIHTVMITFDNQRVVVPNANITSNTITNFYALPTRRIDLTIGIGYSSDLRKAKLILEQLLADEPRVLKNPEPSVVVSDLMDNSVNFAVRGWTMTGDWWGARCALVEQIKLTFDEQGIEIPFPQRSIHIEGLEDSLQKIMHQSSGVSQDPKLD
ncbi:MAG: mechanosensitive ion channel domain-containing protein [Pseudomonadota bacterium]|nr:mechanosensitive ion channel domain-containing protein [Pseudomonadota bacterium]